MYYTIHVVLTNINDLPPGGVNNVKSRGQVENYPGHFWLLHFSLESQTQETKSPNFQTIVSSPVYRMLSHITPEIAPCSI